MSVKNQGQREQKMSRHAPNPEKSVQNAQFKPDKNIGHLFTTPKGGIVDADPALLRLLGFDNVNEISGLSVIDHLTLEKNDRDRLSDALDDKHRPDWLPITMERKDGTTAEVLIHLIAQRDEQENITSYEIQVKSNRKEVVPAGGRNKSNEGSVPPAEKRISVLTEEVLSFVDVLPFPFVILDDNDQIFVWNKAMEDWLDIPAESVLNTDVNQLFLGPSYSIWQNWLVKLRTGNTRSFLSEDQIDLINGQGEVLNCRFLLARLSTGSREFVFATPLSTFSNFQNPVDQTEDQKRTLLFIDDKKIQYRMPDTTRIVEKSADAFRKIIRDLLTQVRPLVSNKTDEQTKTQFRRIESTARLALNTATHLYHIGRSHKTIPINIHINEVIREAVSPLQKSAPKNLTIKFDLTKNSDLIHADRSQLLFCIQVLSLNAIESMRNGGTIVIRTQSGVRLPTQPNGDMVYLQIQIIDKGQGISPESSNRIFEPFYSTRSPMTGRGLGLTTANELVKKNHGLIHIHSKSDNGTTVSLFFPHSDPSIRAFKSRARPRTVLIIDDEPLIIDTCTSILRLYGFETLTAGTAQRGLDILDRYEDIDLAIIDVSLQGRSGAECATRIRQENPKLPIILSSGFSEEKHAADLKSLRAKWLQKPYTPEKLIDTVLSTIKKS